MQPLFLERLEARQMFSASAQLTEVEAEHRQLLQHLVYEPNEISLLQRSFSKDDKTVVASLAPLKTNLAATKAINASVAVFRHSEAESLAGLILNLRDFTASVNRLSSEFMPLAVKWSENRLTTLTREKLVTLCVLISDLNSNWFSGGLFAVDSPGVPTPLKFDADTLFYSLSGTVGVVGSSTPPPTVQAAVADNSSAVEKFQVSVEAIAGSLGEMATTVST